MKSSNIEKCFESALIALSLIVIGTIGSEDYKLIKKIYGNYHVKSHAVIQEPTQLNLEGIEILSFSYNPESKIYSISSK